METARSSSSSSSSSCASALAIRRPGRILLRLTLLVVASAATVAGAGMVAEPLQPFDKSLSDLTAGLRGQPVSLQLFESTVPDLSQALTTCHSDSRSGPSPSSNSPSTPLLQLDAQSEAACSNVQYLSALYEQLASLPPQSPSSSASGSAADATEAKRMDVSKSAVWSFNQFFIDHLETHTPAILDLRGAASPPEGAGGGGTGLRGDGGGEAAGLSWQPRYDSWVATLEEIDAAVDATMASEGDGSSSSSSSNNNGGGAGGSTGVVAARVFGPGSEEEVAGAVGLLQDCIREYTATMKGKGPFLSMAAAGGGGEGGSEGGEEEEGGGGGAYEKSMWTMPKLDEVCPAVMDRVLVPSLLFNDYLARLTDASIEGKTTDEKSGKPLAPKVSPFRSAPTVMAMPPPGGSATSFTTTPQHACGSGMHALLEVAAGAVEVRLFASPFATDGSSTDNANDVGQSNNNSGESDASSSFTESMSSSNDNGNRRYLTPFFGSTASTLHHFSYESPPTTGSSDGDGDGDGFQRLSRGSRLFVPYSTLVSMRSVAEAAEGEGEAEGKPGAVLLQYCFVDASNLNLVKELSVVDAHVDGESRKLAKALMSLHLDTTMQRQPAALPFSDHQRWPRDPEVVSAAAAAAAALSAPGGSSSAAAAVAAVANRGKRSGRRGGGEGGGGRRSQKDWQAEMKWKWRIVGLTLPTLDAPEVLAMRRRSATLRWYSGFRVQDGDSTEFGYNITWFKGHASSSSTAATATATATAAASKAIGEPDGHYVLPHKSLVEMHSKSRNDAYVGFAVDDYNVHEMSYALPEGTMEPATEYTFRIFIYYGSAEGPSSRSSRPVQSPPLSAPGRMNVAPYVELEESEMTTAASVKNEETGETRLAIVAPPPLDDGGMKIEGYVVEMRHMDPSMLGQWHSLGSFPPDNHAKSGSGLLRFTVEHLLPHCGYQFRLRAYNKVGLCGTPGTASDTIRTGEDRTQLLLEDDDEQTKRKGRSSTVGAHLKKRDDPNQPLKGHHVLGRGARKVTVHHFKTDEGQAGAEAAEWAAAREAKRLLLVGGKKGKDVVAHLSDLHHPDVFKEHGPVITFSDVTSSVTHNPSKGKHAHKKHLHLEVWVAHWSPKAYHVSAEMVVADPPMLDGTAGKDGSAFRNARAAHHRIVLVERGGVPLVDKVLRAQAAGALGVLITDTGYCKSFDQFCSAGADKANGEGFAKLDLKGPWSKVKIPVAMVLREDADELLALFDD